MLFLNNPHLLTEQIIISFKQEVMNAAVPKDPRSPSALQRFKNKLKAIFFEKLDKSTTDDEVLDALRREPRFTEGYAHLTQVLSTLFLLDEQSNKTAVFEQLKTEAAEVDDWNASQSDAQFERLNNKYGYFFDSAEHDAARHALFKRLAITCRTMIVLFEENNTPDDTMAYDYAYKLMALFLDPTKAIEKEKDFNFIAKQAHALLTKSDTKKEKPFHDTLLVRLALPDARELNDLSGWRALIQQEGDKAFYWLAMAQKIEVKISEQTKTAPRAPKDKNEATKIAMLCSYARASEDPTFAGLCHKYKVSETRFNACLDYIQEPPGWPKKSTDTVPDLQIKGRGAAEGYQWVKLPADDKRALILGDITDCCQSIAGNSEACVKNAVTLSDNGLYVLLKQRKKGDELQALSEDTKGRISINDQSFDIVGQSYTWKSTTGNVCLDSIECLKDSIFPEALKSILSDFGDAVLKNNPEMYCVNLGRGGKTPSYLFASSSVSEIIRQGGNYGDANYQYCISRSENQLLEQLPYDIKKVYKRELLVYIEHYLTDSGNFLEDLKQLRKDNQSFLNDLTGKAFMLFLSLSPKPTLADFAPVDFDALDKLSMDERNVQLENISVARLMWAGGPEKPEQFLRALSYLSEEKQVEVLTHIWKIDPSFLLYEMRHDIYSIPSLKKALPLFVQSVLDLDALLSFLKPSNYQGSRMEQAFILEALKEKLPSLITSGKELVRLSASLANKECNMMIMAMEKKLPELKLSDYELTTLLENSRNSGSKLLCTAFRAQVPEIIQDFDSVFCVFGPFINEERTALDEDADFFFDAIKDRLGTDIISSVSELRKLAEKYQGNYNVIFVKFFDALTDKLPELTESIRDFVFVLKHLEPQKHEAYIDAMKEQKSSLHNDSRPKLSPSECSEVLSTLKPELRTVVFEMFNEGELATFMDSAKVNAQVKIKEALQEMKSSEVDELNNDEQKPLSPGDN